LKSFSSFIFIIRFVGLETCLFFHHLHFSSLSSLNVFIQSIV
jgi:hypothetical protein